MHAKIPRRRLRQIRSHLPGRSTNTCQFCLRLRRPPYWPRRGISPPLTRLELRTLTSVTFPNPNNHIVKLASIVTEGVIIYNMIHAKQLASILVSIKVKCPGLRLDNMQLSLADTRSLVISMRNRVEDVLLYDVAVVIESLCDYDGRGHCTMLRVWGLTRLKHADRLRRWTTDVGWTVKRDDDECLWLQRK